MSENTSELINIRGTLRKYLKKWYWFVISIAAFVALGGFIAFIKQPKYEIRASVKLNEDNAVSQFIGGGMSGVAQIFGGNSSAADEAEIMQAHSILRTVVLNQGLDNVLYERLMPLVKRQITKNKPLIVEPVESTILTDTLRKSLNFKINLENKSEAKSIKVTAGSKTLYSGKNVGLPTTIKTDYGDFSILTTPYFTNDSGKNYRVKITSPDIAAEDLRATELNISQATKQSSIIEMQMIAADEDLAKNILNDIVDVYNHISHKEQKYQMGATSQFLEDRLKEVRGNLSTTENELEKYKEKEGLGMLEADGMAMYERLGETEKLLTAQQAETEMARIALELAKESAKDNSTIPPLTGSEALGTLINAYNTQVLKRMQLATAVKPDNAALERLDNQISHLRATMIKTLEDAYASSKGMENELRRVYDKANNQIKTLPGLENSFRQIARNQEIEEQIYVFLLQKQEEIKVLFNDDRPKARIIDRAYSTHDDTSLSSSAILLICILFGLMTPPVIFYCKENLFSKNKKETKED
ncbi:MAG: Wzz/FepE/Etk N-terminal domain-containing protein [Bacteroides sp.]|nr:Wzz/FepE/Etk N-terminal domain-containing protein [Bacteroides sp.]MCM1380232.1 Wzz/FepE/Etk N-terminal domain-containing protein [Bacteroides sp.]MCM1446540.1 Wzz/FepE/Etk N-terminal domain-containing protein [Prevotella sp.]